MALPSNKDNFTFNHTGQPDDLGLSYGGDYAQIQALFDSRGEELRVLINDLLGALKSVAPNDSGAKQIGVSPIAGVVGTDIQTSLESLKTAIDNVSVGTIPDESISPDKQSDVLSGLHRQAIINGNFSVANYPQLAISNSYGQTPCDGFMAKADTTNITGTVAKVVNVNKKNTLKFTLTSSSSTGVVALRTLIPSADARAYVNEVASLGVKVNQSVIGKDYTLAVYKADAEDDFNATTLIDDITLTLSDNSSEIKLQNVSMGDCSNGIEVLLSFIPNVVGGETFEFADLTMNKGKYTKPISPISLYDTQIKLGSFNSHLAENGIDAHGIIPSCKVYHNQDQSIVSSTLTALAFNSERWDTDNIHDVATNNNRLVCKTPGKYLVIGQVMFATNSTGVRSLSIRQNGSTTMATTSSTSLTGQETSLGVSTILDLDVNDYVELLVYQNAGTALNVLDNQQRSPYLMMVKVG